MTYEITRLPLAGIESWGNEKRLIHVVVSIVLLYILSVRPSFVFPKSKKQTENIYLQVVIMFTIILTGQVDHWWLLSCMALLSLSDRQMYNCSLGKKSCCRANRSDKKHFFFKRNWRILLPKERTLFVICVAALAIYFLFTIDPPGHGRIGGHYFHAVSVRSSQKQKSAAKLVLVPGKQYKRYSGHHV